jgi:hypothetical protein
MACIWWTLRTLARVSERSLLGGAQQAFADHAQRPATRSGATAAFRPVIAAVVFAAFAFALIAASARGVVDPAAAFFGAGSALLVASLFAVAARLKGAWRSPAVQTGPRAVWRLGIRNASDRPGRTVLAIGVIASATFMLISVGAFRRDTLPAADRQSGVGGYPLLVDLLLPVADDPNGRDGRAAIGIPTGDQVHVDPFRVRPGDDASCLNLYEPRNPRVLGVSQGFITSGRFAFQSSIAADAAERANPWVLLNRRFDGDVVPVIADANSMTYVLHKSLGDDIVIAQGGRPIRLRLVAALADSVFQGELLMADTQFVRLFPEQQGYRFLLVDAPADRAAALANAIEETASDLGADAVPTTERLAQFHTVENTYLSTFQMLGGLGLVIGTIGLASVVLRNVLERRRELALLAAVGYRRDHIFTIVVSENLFVLICGLAIGALCASIAIAPAVSQHGGRLPATRWDAVLLIAVFGAGLLSSIVATRAALHTQLLNALRSE